MTGTLLIVDDEDDVLSILAEYLAAQGHRVVQAATASEALVQIRSGHDRFDVLIVDWTLPDLPGREVLAALREAQPGCGVIITTGHGDDVVSDASAGGGVGGVLRKPFTMRTLAVRVEMLLAQRRA
jgi:DNA-binding response OmpR family regulator